MSINSRFTISDVLLNQESLQKKDKYSCPICFEYFYKKSINIDKPDHVACQECWEKSLENKKECMICRSKVNSTNDLSRCLVIEQDFGKKECYCIYSFTDERYDTYYPNEKITFVKDEENGCKERINVDQLDTHIQNCKFKFVKCSHNGCDEILRLNSLKEHENQCGFKLVTCGFCACDDIRQMELENHLEDECSKFLIDCPYDCSIIIERDQIKSHIENECNNAIIACKYYEYGCKEEMKRSELQNHLNNINHQYFMGLLIEKLSSKLTQSHIIQNELVKKIKRSEKIKENPKYKNKWTISNYSNIISKFPNDKELQSPIFQINSNNILNPNHNSISSQMNFTIGYMPIFLQGNIIEGTNIEFICKLVNVLDKTKSIESEFQHEFKNIGNREWDWIFGWSHFIESRVITKENGWLSKDDKLTIKFKVILFNNVIKPLES
ncbi:hypothetical protein ACTFIZ_011958 [Dictyostelium cf. discoideum]